MISMSLNIFNEAVMDDPTYKKYIWCAKMGLYDVLKADSNLSDRDIEELRWISQFKGSTIRALPYQSDMFEWYKIDKDITDAIKGTICIPSEYLK